MLQFNFTYLLLKIINKKTRLHNQFMKINIRIAPRMRIYVHNNTHKHHKHHKHHNHLSIKCNQFLIIDLLSSFPTSLCLPNTYEHIHIHTFRPPPN